MTSLTKTLPWRLSRPGARLRLSGRRPGPGPKRPARPKPAAVQAKPAPPEPTPPQAAPPPAPPPAPLPPRDYHILGVGTISCADWTKETKAAIAHSQNQAWILGYLTAFNRFGPDNTGDVMGKTGNREALAWFDNYCVENPADSVNKAAGALILELERRKTAAATPDPKPDPKPPPAEVRLSPPRGWRGHAGRRRR